VEGKGEGSNRAHACVRRVTVSRLIWFFVLPHGFTSSSVALDGWKGRGAKECAPLAFRFVYTTWQQSASWRTWARAGTGWGRRVG